MTDGKLSQLPIALHNKQLLIHVDIIIKRTPVYVANSMVACSGIFLDMM